MLVSSSSLGTKAAARIKMPFLAVGPQVKTGYAGSVSYTHSSLTKSIEAILRLPTLSKVASANELPDLFSFRSTSLSAAADHG
jgi:hypothetical protein